MSNLGHTRTLDSDTEQDPLLPSHQDASRRNAPSARRSLSAHLTGSSASKFVPSCISITILLLVLLVVLALFQTSRPYGYRYYQSAITQERFRHGLDQCRKLSQMDVEAAGKSKHKNELRRNPRAKPHQESILIRNAYVFDPVTGKRRADVLVKNGVVANISCTISDYPEDTHIIHANGNYLTPGLVDMHTHLGVYSWPELDATSDGNEMTGPTLPQMKVVDAFDPKDPAIRQVLSGGVTTVLVIPGSANLMGGQGAVFKLGQTEQGTVQEMLLETDKDGLRWMKWACGENPKRVYGERGQMPATRMGSAFMFRKQIAEAAKLRQSQDNWCASAKDMDGAEYRMAEAYPEDVALESLTALLRGHVHLNIHCYQTNDLEAMLRIASDYSIKIKAFHHALEAYMIPEVIRKSNVTIATFSDLWGYKKEAMRASVHQPHILADSKVPVALVSDHPVINSQYLMNEASKSHHYGLDGQVALASVTSVPAKALGIAERVGRVEVGWDADLVLWNKDPLALGAYPKLVMVDGRIEISTQDMSSADTSSPVVDNDDVTEQGTLIVSTSLSSCSPKSQTYTIHGMEKIYTGPGQVLVKGDEELKIVVRGGRVHCIGVHCHSPAESDDYYLNGGIVIPGMVSTGTPLGMIEIESDSSTGDGYTDASQSEPLRAEDGISFGGEHMVAASRAGVTTTISPPNHGEGLFVGSSVAVRTASSSGMQVSAFIKDEVALHVQIGGQGKAGATPTVSSQIALLRRLLLPHLQTNTPSSTLNATSTDVEPNLMYKVARGYLPLAVHTNNRDHIAAAIRLREQMRFELTKNTLEGPGMKVIIVGGAEAWTLASDLALEEVPVILQPVNAAPMAWEARHALPGPPLSVRSALDILKGAGVKVAVAANDIGSVRNLRWDAGWTVGRGVVDEMDAIGMVTWNLADMFGLEQEGVGRLRVGDRALLVGLDGPFASRSSHVVLVAGGADSGVMCHPEQA